MTAGIPQSRHIGTVALGYIGGCCRSCDEAAAQFPLFALGAIRDIPKQKSGDDRGPSVLGAGVPEEAYRLQTLEIGEKSWVGKEIVHVQHVF